MESVASLGMFLWFWVSPRTHDPVSIVFLALWQTHYLYRAFIFPVTRKGKHKPMPVSIMLSAVLFNGINGYLNGRWLFTLGPERCLEWFWDSRFIVGCGLFFAGLIINRHSDRILLGLRKSGEENYSIPYGGLFRFVSMPNYLGEIIQWVGWALATWSLGGLSFALFTAANLVPRAYKIHQWYQSHFPDYPKDRRAIVPFVF
jgi:protein-S-isoprenylcysteine O-methyltransferase Ste14